MKYILGGHWNIAPEGWIVLTQADQDITAPLKWKDGEVEALFLEHVLEHVNMTDAILFMREAYRVLKPGGILRIVCPFLDQLVNTFSDRVKSHQILYENYFKNSLAPHHQHDIAILEEVGIPGEFAWRQFMFDSLIKRHGHQMLWTVPVMVRVLERIGFQDVCTPEVDDSFLDGDTCLERKIRGVDESMVRKMGYSMFDPESCVVEARK